MIARGEGEGNAGEAFSGGRGGEKGWGFMGTSLLKGDDVNTGKGGEGVITE